MSPTKLVFGELRLVGVVVVRDADPAKLLPQHFGEHHFASTDAALEQHGGERAEDPRVARPFADLPTGLVDVENRRPGHQFGNRVVFHLPVRGQLEKQRVGLRLRQFQPREKGENPARLVDRHARPVDEICQRDENLKTVFAFSIANAVDRRKIGRIGLIEDAIVDVLGLAVDQPPHKLLPAQHTSLPNGTVPIEIKMLRCLLGLRFFRPSAGRFLAPLFAMLSLVPIDAVVARLFRRLGLLRLGLFHEKLLQLLDLSFEFFDARGLLLDLRVTLSELFFQFGNRHAGRLRDSAMPQKISFQNGQIPS